MIDFFQNLLHKLEVNSYWAPALSFVITGVVIFIVSFISDFIAKRYLVKIVRLLIKRAHKLVGRSIEKHKIIHRLAHLAPAFAVYLMAPLFDVESIKFGATLVLVLRTLAEIYMIITVCLVIDGLLRTGEEIGRAHV